MLIDNLSHFQLINKQQISGGAGVYVDTTAIAGNDFSLGTATAFASGKQTTAQTKTLAKTYNNSFYSITFTLAFAQATANTDTGFYAANSTSIAISINSQFIFP